MAQLTRLEVGSDASFGNKAVTATSQLVLDRQKNRVSLVMRNNGTTDLFWGPTAGVTIANGYPLLPDEEYVFDDYRGPVYVICATTGDLRYFEVR